ncbi:MAG: Ig-like domain-containing protein, partial [Halanaeroarchaeum sp.]
MNDTTTLREKGTALFLAALMVVSMVAVSATLLGGSAVALNQQPGASDAIEASPATAGDTSTHTINVNTSLDGTLDEANISYSPDNGSTSFNASGISASDVTVHVEGDPVNVTSATGGSDTVDININESDGNASVSPDDNVTITIDGIDNPSPGGESDVTVELTDTENNTDSGTFQLVIWDEEKGFLTGNIRNQDGQRIPNAEDVRLLITDEYGNQVVNDTAGNLSGWNEADEEFTVEVPTANGSTDYTVEAFLLGYEDFAGTQTVQSGTTVRQDIRLEGLEAEQLTLDAEPANEQAAADGIDSITYTVTAEADNGEPVPFVPINATDDGSLEGMSWMTDQVQETGADGTAVFEINSTEQGTVNLTFTDDDGDAGNVTTTAEFVSTVGAGEIVGEVYDRDNDGHALEDAEVWTVQREDFLENSVNVSVPQDEGDYWFYRVLDAETGEPLDINKDYRIDNDGQNDDLSIQRLDLLNYTNASAGSGFAVEANANNSSDMFVTPLKPGEYILQRSPTAPNAVYDGDAARIGSDTDPEESFSTVDDGEFEVMNDITYDAQSVRAEATGQNLVDTTDSHGKYVLDKLETNFQSGIEYVVMSTKSGYDTRFVDALVAEDGSFFEDGEDENFALRQYDQPAQYLEFENYGLHPPVSLTDGVDLNAIEEFDNKSAEYPQVVPRDGSVDVIRVETRYDEDEPLVGADVRVEVPDDGGSSSAQNFTGEVIDVIGGEIVEETEDDV